MQKTIDTLHRAMQGSWDRNTAIASNIANYNTPGYKRVDVNFKEALRLEIEGSPLRTTHDKHIKSITELYHRDFTEYGTKYRVDGNNVDINVENAELAKNYVYFQVLVDEVNSQFQRLKTAMRLGK